MVYTYCHFVYTQGKVLIESSIVIATVGSFLSILWLVSKYFYHFVWNRHCIGGVAYHSAAKCKIITAKFHLSQFKTFETKFSLPKFSRKLCILCVSK